MNDTLKSMTDERAIELLRFAIKRSKDSMAALTHIVARLAQQPAAAVPADFLGWVRRDAITELRSNSDVNGIMVHEEERRDSVKVYLAPQALASNAGVPEGLRDFLSAKMHHLPVEDQHVLSVFLSAAPSPQEAK